MAWLDCNSGPLYYRESGSGQFTVMLLHEYFGTGESWAGQRSWLGRHARVLTPDLPGHGRSVIDPDSRIRVAHAGSDLVRLLDSNAVERVHIVGCSLGAILGLWVASRYPERIASLTLSSIPDIHNPGAQAYAREYAGRVFPRIEASLDRVHGGGTPGYSRWLLLRNFELDLQDMPEDHATAYASAFSYRGRALIISGDNDPVFTPESAASMRRSMTDTALAVLPDTGHLVHQEMPGIFNQLLLEHLLSSQSE
ncbi:MAG: alpha/beta hydrolase [Thermomicrobiaceae bacterium]